MRSLRTLSLIVSLGFGLLFMDSGLLFAQGPNPPAPPPTPVDTSLDALRQKAQQKGHVLVVVGLKTGQGFQPEGGMAASAAVVQQAAIASAQNTLISAAGINKTNITARYKYVPYIALKLDAAALDRLIASGQAATIQEDVPIPPNMTAETGLINADRMWALTYDGTGWVVAILDTGIDEDHPYFTGRIIQADQACFSNAGGSGGETSLCPDGTAAQLGAGSADVDTVACNSGALCPHGSNVAGIAAGDAATAPLADGSGVAPAAQILPVQVFTRFDDANSCNNGAPPCVLSFTSDMIKGLDHIYSLRSTYNIAAVNMSIGAGRYTAACDLDSRKASIDNLWSAGIATVVSAGNNEYSDSVSSPACISTVIAVGATDDGDNMAWFSNRGPLLDIMAPGYLVNSAIPDDTFADYSGTSMAAPMVTGAFAILRESNSGASVGDIADALIDSGVSLSYVSGGGTVSTPRLDILGAYGILNSANSRPNNPRNPSPDNGESPVPRSGTLYWSGGDPDGDSVTYTVYLDTANPPLTPVATCTNISATSCDYTVLTSATYYWRVDATDSGGTTTGPVWSLGTNSAATTDNNEFAKAIEISSMPFTENRTTGSANKALDDPVILCTGFQETHSVWYKWTAPATGTLSLNTTDSDYDTVLAVWSGNRGKLNSWACNDQESITLNTSSLGTRVDKGVTYYFEVAGYNGGSGNGEFGNLVLKGDFTQDTNTAPYTPDVPNPEIGTIDVASTPTLSWVGGDPNFGDGVTYDVFVGTTSSPATLACDDAPASSCVSTVTLSNNTIYYWKVTATDEHNSSVTGPVWSFLAGTPAAPPNDDFANATLVNTLAFTDTEEVTGATTELNDPTLPCASDYGTPQKYQSVWYKLNAAHNGTLNISIDGSSYPAIIGVWTGTAGSLTSVDCDPGGAAAIAAAPSISGLSVTGGTTYYIEVANSSPSIATMSISIGYTTTNTPPTAPTLIAPANRSTGISDLPTFSWNPATDIDGDALTYSVYAGTSSKTPDLVCSGVSGTTCPFAPGRLGLGGKYYWKVVATDSVFASRSSIVGSFTVAAAPPGPTAPKNGSAVIKPVTKLSWKTVKGATAYHVEIDTADTFDSNAGNPLYESSPDPAKTSLTVSGLDYGHYFWRVSAFVAGQWTEISLPWTFDMTLHKTPAKNAAIPTHLPKFTWQIVSGSTLYHLEIDTLDTFDSAGGSPLIARDVTSPTYTLLSSDPVLDFGRYYWRVKSTAGVTTSYTPTWAFDITSLKGPKNASVVKNFLPKFSWGADPLAVGGYDLTVSKVDEDTQTETTLGMLNPKHLSGTTYSALIGDGFSYGHYVWHIAGIGSPYTADTPDFAFYITNMSKPANNAISTDNTPTFAWKKVTGQTGYVLKISTTPDFSAVVHSYSLGATATTYTPPVFDGLPRGVYYWRIESTPGGLVMPGWVITIGP